MLYHLLRRTSVVALSSRTVATRHFVSSVCLRSFAKASVIPTLTQARFAHGHVDNTSTPHGRLRRFVSGKHLNTLDRLFEHPPNLNIHWKDVQKMFASMGAEVTETHHGKCKIKYNGRTHAFSLPNHGDSISSKDELVEIRHFLQECLSGERKNDSAVTDGTHFLVVLDGKHTKIYRMLKRGNAPEEIKLHTQHNTDLSHSTGHGDSDRHKAFAELEKALSSAEEILFAGHGKGKSNAAQQLLHDAQKHAPSLAKKVVGILPIDEKHVTEAQLLAAATKYYTALHESS